MSTPSLCLAFLLFPPPPTYHTSTHTPTNALYRLQRDRLRLSRSSRPPEETRKPLHAAIPILDIEVAAVPNGARPARPLSAASWTPISEASKASPNGDQSQNMQRPCRAVSPRPWPPTPASQVELPATSPDRPWPRTSASQVDSPKGRAVSPRPWPPTPPNQVDPPKGRAVSPRPGPRTAASLVPHLAENACTLDGAAHSKSSTPSALAIVVRTPPAAAAPKHAAQSLPRADTGQGAEHSTQGQPSVRGPTEVNPAQVSPSPPSSPTSEPAKRSSWTKVRPFVLRCATPSQPHQPLLCYPIPAILLIPTTPTNPMLSHPRHPTHPNQSYVTPSPSSYPTQPSQPHPPLLCHPIPATA